VCEIFFEKVTKHKTINFMYLYKTTTIEYKRISDVSPELELSVNVLKVS
jgi:hypothetical protein